ncbi:class I SAM-dependent methyltransferase, partial [Rhizobium leguminosarum]|uniref:class I SAM-dependent methyltransferase n=1 Tax=Rhizobium leguminosarum TaxID=384 RepID=UPI003F9CB5AE
FEIDGNECRHALRQSGLVDFEHEDLKTRLIDSGFEPETPSFLIWLGVVPYLSEASVFALLRLVARLPRASIVFEYSEPLENY